MEKSRLEAFYELRLVLLTIMNRRDASPLISEVKKTLKKMRRLLGPVKIDERAKSRLSLLCRYSTSGGRKQRFFQLINAELSDEPFIP